MDATVALSIRQFSAAWRAMCTSHAGHRAAVVGDVEYIFAGVPIGFFNVALVTADDLPGDRLASIARASIGWAAETHVPWLFVVTHENLARGVDAAAVLADCGMAPLMPLTGMVARQLTPGAAAPADLQVAVPQDDETCGALLDVNGLAYGMDLALGKPLIGHRAFWAGHVPVLGVVDGQPASCAAVLMVGGHRYVALVATNPAMQRRGYAEAAMRHALDVAATEYGDVPTFLHATDAGRPIYQRMGYQTVAAHTVFMERRFLEGH